MQSDQDNIDGLIEQAFINTDRRIAANQRVTPAFIYAVLLWPVVERKATQLRQQGNSTSYSISKAGSEAISNQIAVTAIPKRFTIPMREIWDLQIQLPRRGGNRAQRLSEHPRFRAAYDFVLLREQSGEDLEGLGDWWTKYQSADGEARLSMVTALPKNPAGNRRRNRRRGSKKS
jgi:poly(A) polymerase